MAKKKAAPRERGGRYHHRHPWVQGTKSSREIRAQGRKLLNLGLRVREHFQNAQCRPRETWVSILRETPAVGNSKLKRVAEGGKGCENCSNTQKKSILVTLAVNRGYGETPGHLYFAGQSHITRIRRSSEGGEYELGNTRNYA